MTTTPETDAVAAASAQGSNGTSYAYLLAHARKIERERDDAIAEATNAVNDIIAVRYQRDAARELCRWAFPRLRAMCHDFDNTDTGWECAEKMAAHPDIFMHNEKSAGADTSAPRS